MEQTSKANATALNLQSVNEYLIRDITAGELAGQLDKIIFDFNSMLENFAGECNFTFSNNVFRLRELRDLFMIVAHENKQTITFNGLEFAAVSNLTNLK